MYFLWNIIKKKNKNNFKKKWRKILKFMFQEQILCTIPLKMLYLKINLGIFVGKRGHHVLEYFRLWKRAKVTWKWNNFS